jgi:hypothetical protein
MMNDIRALLEWEGLLFSSIHGQDADFVKCMPTRFPLSGEALFFWINENDRGNDRGGREIFFQIGANFADIQTRGER